MNYRALAGVAAVLFSATVGLSAAAGDSVAPNPEGDPDVARVQAYLNAIDTLRADFIQVSPNGAISDGVFTLQRPGGVRFAYNPPSQILVVGKGKRITLIDYEIGQVSGWSISDTPFRVLIDDELRFGDNIKVSALDRAHGGLAVTLVSPRDRKQGSIKLVFARDPLELRQWVITDSQGKVTTIGLSHVQTHVDIDPALFTFKDPRPKVRRRRR